MNNDSKSVGAELLEQMLKLLHTKESDQEHITEQLVTARGELHGGMSAPSVRVSHLTDKLDEIEQKAAELANLVNSYEQDLQAFDPTDLGVNPLMASEEGWDIQSSAYLDFGVSPSLIQALSRSAGAARGFIVERFGTGDADRPDQGGPAITTKLYGSAKQIFIEQLLYVWGQCRPPETFTSTADGELAQFVELACQWAEIDSRGLHDILKRLAPRARCRHALVLRAHQYEVRALNLRRIGSTALANHFSIRASRIWHKLTLNK